MEMANLPTRDQVLDDFICAFDARSVKTVRVWMKKYPDFAREILDFAIEIIRVEVVDKNSPESHVEGTDIVLSALSRLHDALYKQREGFRSRNESHRA